MKYIKRYFYIDPYYYETQAIRRQQHQSHNQNPKATTIYNNNVLYTKQVKGRTGRIALGSLLVAMEANDYVLTLESNWSRLMNEIRMNIINPRCNSCTLMIDVQSMI